MTAPLLAIVLPLMASSSNTLPDAKTMSCVELIVPCFDGWNPVSVPVFAPLPPMIVKAEPKLTMSPAIKPELTIVRIIPELPLSAAVKIAIGALIVPLLVSVPIVPPRLVMPAVFDPMMTPELVKAPITGTSVDVAS